MNQMKDELEVMQMKKNSFKCSEVECVLVDDDETEYLRRRTRE